MSQVEKYMWTDKGLYENDTEEAVRSCTWLSRVCNLENGMGLAKVRLNKYCGSGERGFPLSKCYPQGDGGLRQPLATEWQ